MELTYLLTPWCRVLPEQLPGLQLVKKFPAFHGTRRFITAFRSVHYLSLSWARQNQSTCPHPTSWKSIQILSTHLRLGLDSGLHLSSFPTKTLYTPLSSLIRATCPAHLILLDFITRTILGEEYKSFTSSLCNLLQSPFTSSLLGPNILLNTLFSNTLSLLNSRNVSDHVSHPYKTTGNIRILYILIFTFLVSNFEHKRFCTEWQKATWPQSALNFFHNRILICYSCSQIFKIFHPLEANGTNSTDKSISYRITLVKVCIAAYTVLLLYTQDRS